MTIRAPEGSTEILWDELKPELVNPKLFDAVESLELKRFRRAGVNPRHRFRARLV